MNANIVTDDVAVDIEAEDGPTDDPTIPPGSGSTRTNAPSQATAHGMSLFVAIIILGRIIT